MTRISNRNLPLLPIEPGTIPIPALAIPKRARTPHARWGLERLTLGQSVYMDGAQAHPKKLLFEIKKNRGILFTARTYWDENGEPIGVRVWRVV